MDGTPTDEQTQPMTAEWLKANTEIGGWLSFFVLRCFLLYGGMAVFLFYTIGVTTVKVEKRHAEYECVRNAFEVAGFSLGANDLGK